MAMKSWFFSIRWSDKYGTLEGTVAGHKPLILKTEKVLKGQFNDLTLEGTEEIVDERDMSALDVASDLA